MKDGNVDDAKTGLSLIEQVEGDIACVVRDTDYDTAAIYAAAGAREARVVVPPVRPSVVSRSKPPFSARDTTVLKVNAVGRRKWKQESGCHRQGRFKNTFFRYKLIFGGKLRARHAQAQKVEAARDCRILNRMGELGMSKSITIPG